MSNQNLIIYTVISSF